MPTCCYTDEYGELFSEGTARRTARRFTRRGLRGSAQRLADAVAATGVIDATILEVGGGVGDIQAELLRRGAASSTNVELSPNWEEAAADMLAELGLAERVQRRIGDFVDEAEDLPTADVVILHRVICCYPDWEAMLAATTAKAHRVIAITLPVDHWGTRVGTRLANRLLQLRRRAFRAYVHPPQRIIAALETAGFPVVTDQQGVVWRTIVGRRNGVAHAPIGP